MKSISTLFRQLFLIVVLISAFSLSAWGKEVTISFASTTQRISQNSSSQVWKNGDVTFTNNKASSSSAVGDFSNPVRLYASSNIVIDAPSNITKIVFDCNSNSYATAMKNSIGTISGATVSTSSDKVTVTFTSAVESFTVAKLTAQVRLDAITVTYTPPTTPTLEIEPASIDFGEIEQNTTQTKTFTIEGSNLTSDVTLSINSADFTLDKTSITPTDGNVDETITITLNTQNIGKKSGTITVSNNEVVDQTISLSANVIAPKQKFDVHFWHNGEIVKTIQVSEGESLGEFPIIDNLESCNSNLPTFAGWVTDYVGYENIENTTQPTFFVPTQPINGKTNLYAVFADASSESTWNLVKNISELTNGSKVIIACPTKNVAAGTQNGSYRNSTSITISNEQITDLKSAKIFTLGNTSSGYSFYSDDEKHYVVLTSSANALHTATSLNNTSYYWNITISNNVTSITNKSYTTRKLQYNASSPRFACYTTSQTAISIYKQTVTQATKWTVCTSNDVPELTQLDKPQNLTLTATENSITAKWDIVDNALGYIVSIKDENPQQEIYNQEIYNNTITISELIPEKGYSISVVAKGDNKKFKNSDATNASITTLSITVENINAFIEKADTENNVTISGEVVVTAVSDNKKNVWIKDDSGAILIYSTTATTYVAGDKFSGLKGKYQYYNSAIHEITTSVFPNEKTEGDAPTPETITISDIDDDFWLNKLVKIENVIYTDDVDKGRTFTDENHESINSYDTHFKADQNIQKNYKVNLTAIVGKYSDNYQLYVVSAEIVSRPALLTISTGTIDFGTIETGTEATETFTISGQYLTEDIRIESSNSELVKVSSESLTPTDGSISETNITVKLNTESANEINETITITSGDVEKIINVTATIYAPAQKYIVTFHYNDGSTRTLESSLLEGLAEYAPTLSADNHNITFIGWSETEITEDLTTAPTVYDNSTNVALSGDLDLYPIYSSQQTIVKPFDINSTEPQQVIIAAKYNDVWKALPNSNFSKTRPTAVETSPIWIVTKTNKGYTIYNGSKYLAYGTSGTDILTQEDEYYWNITTNNNDYKITSSEYPNRGLIYRGSNYNVIGAYATSNVNGKEYFYTTLRPTSTQKITYSSIPKWYIDEDATITTNISANIIISSAKQLLCEAETEVKTLTIQSNGDQAGQINVTNGSISANKVILEKTIDDSRWFFFSLPFACNISDIVATDANGNPLTYDTHYVISKYNPTREEGQKNAWEDLLITDKLNANQGYIIGHWYEQSDNIIVKFPSTDAQTITAPADKTLNYTDTWFVDGENSSKGFNLIGMPYYQNINSAISCGDVYIYSTTPNKDGKTYTQEKYTGNNVAPFTSFFVQVAENTAPKFTISTKSSSAPMLRAKDVVAKATITLADANGGADETTVINNPTKTTDYEIGHDLVKWIGYASIPQIYSLQGNEMLAFNSFAIDNSTVIPLGVYAHADGDYTFSLSEKSVGDLQGWELYDNETGSTTRLVYEDLTIYLEQGTHEGRFEIRLQQRIPTVCDNTMGDMMTWTANGTLNISNMPADAVVYIYDAIGRMVHVATPNANTFNYDFVARGVYNIVVRTADNTVSFKTIY